jgi:hypothetical protein
MSQESKTIQSKKKRGRPKMLETSIEFRLSWVDFRFLNTLGYYERREAAELLRYQISQMRKEYRKDRHFQKWLERHKQEMMDAGIPVVEEF